jgi:hypothetical protein
LLDLNLLESIGQSLLLLLQFELAQIFGVLRSLVVDSAFSLLLAFPSAGALILALFDRPEIN